MKKNLLNFVQSSHVWFNEQICSGVIVMEVVISF